MKAYIAIIFCCGAMLLGPRAWAASVLTFGPPAEIGAGMGPVTYSNPKLAGDGQGHWVVVWSSSAGLTAARSADNGTSWSAPVVLAGGGNPSVATDGQGQWVIAWEGEDLNTPYPNKYKILAMRSEDNGASWGSPILLLLPETLGVLYPQIAAGGAGRFGVIFSYPIFNWIQLIRSEDAGLHWSDPVKFSIKITPNITPSWSKYYELTTDQSSNWCIAFAANAPSVTAVAQAYSSTDGGKIWNDSGTIAAGNSIWPIRSARLASRGAVIYMDSSSPPPMGGGIYIPSQIKMLTSSDDGTTWTAPVLLDEEPSVKPAEKYQYIKPVIAADKDGAWLAVWRLGYKPGGQVVGLASSAAKPDGQPVAIFGLPGCAELKSDGQGHWCAIWSTGWSIMFAKAPQAPVEKNACQNEWALMDAGIRGNSGKAY